MTSNVICLFEAIVNVLLNVEVFGGGVVFGREVSFTREEAAEIDVGMFGFGIGSGSAKLLEEFPLV
jgi:hypothetical protein